MWGVDVLSSNLSFYLDRTKEEQISKVGPHGMNPSELVYSEAGPSVFFW